MNRKIRSLVSLLLVTIMMVSSVSVSASAEEVWGWSTSSFVVGGMHYEGNFYLTSHIRTDEEMYFLIKPGIDNTEDTRKSANCVAYCMDSGKSYGDGSVIDQDSTHSLIGSNTLNSIYNYGTSEGWQTPKDAECPSAEELGRSMSMAMDYGYPGKGVLPALSDNVRKYASDDALRAATQLIIWDFTEGYRQASYPYSDVSGGAMETAAGALYYGDGQYVGVLELYNAILAAMRSTKHNSNGKIIPPVETTTNTTLSLGKDEVTIKVNNKDVKYLYSTTLARDKNSSLSLKYYALNNEGKVKDLDPVGNISTENQKALKKNMLTQVYDDKIVYRFTQTGYDIIKAGSKSIGYDYSATVRANYKNYGKDWRTQGNYSWGTQSVVTPVENGYTGWAGDPLSFGVRFYAYNDQGLTITKRDLVTGNVIANPEYEFKFVIWNSTQRKYVSANSNGSPKSNSFTTKNGVCKLTNISNLAVNDVIEVFEVEVLGPYTLNRVENGKLSKAIKYNGKDTNVDFTDSIRTVGTSFTKYFLPKFIHSTGNQVTDSSGNKLYMTSSGVISTSASGNTPIIRHDFVIPSGNPNYSIGDLGLDLSEYPSYSLYTKTGVTYDGYPVVLKDIAWNNHVGYYRKKDAYTPLDDTTRPLPIFTSSDTYSKGNGVVYLTIAGNGSIECSTKCSKGFNTYRFYGLLPGNVYYAKEVVTALSNKARTTTKEVCIDCTGSYDDFSLVRTDGGQKWSVKVNGGKRFSDVTGRMTKSMEIPGSPSMAYNDQGSVNVFIYKTLRGLSNENNKVIDIKTELKKVKYGIFLKGSTKTFRQTNPITYTNGKLATAANSNGDLLVGVASVTDSNISNGVASLRFSNLPAGEYYAKELCTSPYFMLDTTKRDFTIDKYTSTVKLYDTAAYNKAKAAQEAKAEQESASSMLSVSDYPIINEPDLVKVKVVKKSALTNSPVQGAIFEIRYITENTANPTRSTKYISFGTLRTGSNGEATSSKSIVFRKAIQDGKLYVTEKSAPAGFVLDTAMYKVSIAGSTTGIANAVTVIEEEDSTSTTLVKKGNTFNTTKASKENGYNVTKPVFGSSNLSGAEFKLTALTDIKSSDGLNNIYTKNQVIHYTTKDTVLNGKTIKAGYMVPYKANASESDTYKSVYKSASNGNIELKGLKVGRYKLEETKVPTNGAVIYSKANPLYINVSKNSSGNYVTTFYTDANFTKKTSSNTINNTSSTSIEVNKTITDVSNWQNSNYTLAEAIKEIGKIKVGLYANQDFTAADGKKITKGTLIAVKNLNASGSTYAKLTGTVTFSEQVPKGSYYVKEVSVPGSMKQTSGNVTVNVTSGKITCDVVNKLDQYITIKKVSVNDSSKAIAGAVIELYDSNKKLVLKGTTNADGSITKTSGSLGTANNTKINKFTLKDGKYTYKEVKAPKGYKLDTTVHNLNLPTDYKTDGQGNKYIALVISNNYDTYDLQIHKVGDRGLSVTKTQRNFWFRDSSHTTAIQEATDCYIPSYKKENLKGIKFNLVAAEKITSPDGKKTYAKDAVVTSGTTDANGNVKFSNLLPGKYTIKEVSNISPYDPSKLFTKTVTVPYTQGTIEAANTSGKVKLTLVKEVSEKDRFVDIDDLKEAINACQFGVFTAEAIKDTNGKEVIPANAMLGAWHPVAEGDTIETVKGTVTVSRELPIGKYYVKETYCPAPFKFLANDGKWSFEVTRNQLSSSTEYTHVFTNTFDTSFNLIKKDSEDGSALAGATFDITTSKSNSNSVILVHGTTNADGRIVVEKISGTNSTGSLGIAAGTVIDNNHKVKLAPGTYYYRETKVPAGYVQTDLNKWKSFTIQNKSGYTADLTVTNRPVTREIGITKSGDVFVGTKTKNVKLKNGGTVTTHEPKYQVKGLPGAKFKLTAVGKTVDADGSTVHVDGYSTTVTSDNSGDILFKKLGYGKYKIEETVAPQDCKRSTAYIMVTFTKASSGIDPLPTYEVYNSAGTKLSATSTSGNEASYKLVEGEYTGTLTIDKSDSTINLDWENPNPTVSIKARKVMGKPPYSVNRKYTAKDLDLSKAVEDVQFGIYYGNYVPASNGAPYWDRNTSVKNVFGETIGEAGDLVAVATCVADPITAQDQWKSKGTATFNVDLPAGKYYVKELNTNEYYDIYYWSAGGSHINETPFSRNFMVSKNQSYTMDLVSGAPVDSVSVDLRNYAMRAKIKVKKIDNTTGKPVEGALIHFGYVDLDGKDHDVFYGTTNKDGLVPALKEDGVTPLTSGGNPVYEAVVGIGDFYYYEEKAPKGYKTDSTRHTMTVTVDDYEKYDVDGKTLEVTMGNDRATTKLVVNKIGQYFYNGKLESDGTTTPQFFDRKNVRHIDFYLYANEDIKGPDGEVVYTKNTKVGTASAQYGSDAVFDNLYPGKYRLVEQVNPNNNAEYHEYSKDITIADITDNKDHVVTIDVRNELKKVKVSAKKVLETDDYSLIDPKEEIKKVEFSLYNAEEIEVEHPEYGGFTGVPASAGEMGNIPADTLLAKAKCNENGDLFFDTYLPTGYTYYIVETATSEKYILDDTRYEFSIHPYTTKSVLDLNENFGIGNEQPNGDYAIGNTLDTHELYITKLAADTNVPLAGAEFKVEYENGDVVYEGAVNENGVIDISDIPDGTYTITETKAPYGYLLDSTSKTVVVNADSPEVIEVEFTDELVKGEISLTKHGRVFASVDHTGDFYSPVYSDSVLPNAEFTLYADGAIITPDGTNRYVDGQEVKKVTSGADGIVKFDDLYLGKYKIVETKSPDGYSISDEIVSVELTVESAVFDFGNFNNTKNSVKAELVKKMKADRYGVIDTESEVLKVSFGLYADEVLTAQNGDIIPKDGLIEQAYADSKGNVKFVTDLPDGKYYIKELTTSELYELDTNVYKFEASNETSSTINLSDDQEFVNTDVEKPFSLQKVDEETMKGIPGATIEILHNGKVIIHSESGVNGMLKDEEGRDIMLPIGDYTYREVKAPYGYLIDTADHPFSVTKDTTSVDLKLVDPLIKGNITLSKTGALFATVEKVDDTFYSPKFVDGNLEGAEFTVYAAEDIITGDGTVRYKEGDVADVLVTGADGNVKSKDLYLGKYKVVETKAPKGYIATDAVVTVELNEGTTLFDIGDVYNEKTVVDVKLSKQMQKDRFDILDDKVEVLKVSFGLYANEDIIARDGTIIPKDGLIEQAYADTKGHVIFFTNLPDGEYYVKEMTTSEYYILDDTKHYFTVDDVKTYTIDLTEVTVIRTPDTPESGDTPIVETYDNPIINRPDLKRVNMRKVDDETGKGIPGAEIELTYGDRVIYTGTSGEDGYFVDTFDIPVDLPYGDYKYHETKAPHGYMLDTNEYPLTIDENTETIDIALENTNIKGHVSLTKRGMLFATVDNSDNMFYSPKFIEGGLAGAEFTIFAVGDVVTGDGTVRYHDGDVVEKIISDEEGIVKSKDLYLGTYMIRETAAPKGYVLNENAITFTLDEDNVVFDFGAVTNDKNIVTVRLSKQMQKDEHELVDDKVEILKVSFGLFANEDIVAKDGTKIPAGGMIEKVYSTSKGDVKFSTALPDGKYYVQELTTSEYYILDTNKYEFVVDDAVAHEINLTETVDEATMETYDEPLVNALDVAPISMRKVDYQTKKGIAGAEIEILCGNKVVFKGTSDEDGYFFKDTFALPHGDYIYREVKAPAEYIIDTQDHPFKVDAETKTIDIELENKNVMGRLSISKYGRLFATVDVSDEMVYTPRYLNGFLKDAKFGIYADEDIVTPDGTVRYEKGTLVQTLLTNEKGIVTSDDLFLGKYFIKEIEAPHGYALSDKVIYVTLSEENTVFDFEIDNTRNSVTATLHKTMEVDKNKIVDAAKEITKVSFGLFAAEDIVAMDGRMIPKDGLIQQVYCDADGNIAFKDELPDGTYYVKEMTTSEYYVLDTDTYEFTVDNEKTETIDLAEKYDFVNEVYEVGIKIKKVDESTNKPIAGAEIEILSSDGVVLYNCVSGDDGIFVATNDEPIELPIGKYSYKETKAPYGYVVDTNTYPFEVKGDEKEPIELVMNNTNIMGSISLTKVGERFKTVVETKDEADPSTIYYKPNYYDGSLDGAIFEVFAKDDIVTPEGTVRIKAGDSVGTMTTDAYGVAKIDNLYLGTYIVREIKAPNGYELSKTDYEVTLTGDLFNVDIEPITNTRKKFNVTFNKTLENEEWGIINHDSEVIKVRFGLYAAEDIVADDGTKIPAGGLIEKAYADVNNLVWFSEYLPYGKYYVQELETSEYYVLDSTKHEFEVNADSEALLDLGVTDSFVNHIDDKSVEFKKVAAGTDQPLAGAEIEISYGKTVIYTGVTGDDGMLKNVPELPIGTYTFRELKAPKGYKLDPTMHTFEITKDTKVVELKFENTLGWGTVEITKADIVTGETIPNCGIRIYDINGNIIVDGRTDNNGIVTFEKIPVGKYYYQEFDAPEGYEIDEGKYPFEIEEDGQIVKCRLEDKRIEVPEETPDVPDVPVVPSKPGKPEKPVEVETPDKPTPEAPTTPSTPKDTPTPVTTATPTPVTTTTTVPDTPVKTGDTTNVGMFGILFLVSALVLFLARKEEDEE